MGRVSPRNSSRAGSVGNGDSQGKHSNSSVRSSPLLQEVMTETRADAANDLNESLWRESNSPEGAAGHLVGTQQAQPLPPPSQPLLEGGSGMEFEMTSIREE